MLYKGEFLGFLFKIFWKRLEFFGLFLGPQGPQNGPRDPGDRFKIPPKNFDFFKNLGQKCQLFLKFRFFVFLAVFKWKIEVFDFFVFFTPGGPGPRGYIRNL